MRILVLNQYYPPDLSASAQLLDELCEDLSSKHEVWVVTGRPSYNVAGGSKGGLLVRERRGRTRVVRVWSTSFVRASMTGRLLNYVTFLATSLAGAIATPKPDVVLTLTDPPPVVVIGAIISRLRRAPYVLSMQDITPESVVVAGELRNPIVIALMRLVTHAGFRSARRVIAIGADMRERLETLGVPDDKIEVVQNWADGELIRPLGKQKNPFRTARGWEGTFVVMHSGNLGMGQDLESLIDAAALLREKQDILFAIVGEGMRKSYWQEKVRTLGLNNVEFVPFQPKSRLAESLGAGDVHLVVHRRGMEGYQVPSKLYGILAAGKPCIAAVVDGCEVATTVKEADCGVVVDPDDPAAIAAAVLALRDSSSLAALGENARRLFEDRFNRPLATARYEEILSAAATDIHG